MFAPEGRVLDSALVSTMPVKGIKHRFCNINTEDPNNDHYRSTFRGTTNVTMKQLTFLVFAFVLLLQLYSTVGYSRCGNIPTTMPTGSNSGSKNPGSNNSGSNHAESNNSGSTNSEANNLGLNHSGSYNLGSTNSGANNSGSNHAGSNNSGSTNSGMNNSGSDNSGLNHSGSNNLGSTNSGVNNSGLNHSGSNNAESTNSGANNPGSNNLASNNVGNSVTSMFGNGIQSANKVVDKTQSNAIQVLNNFNPLSIMGRK